MRHTSPADYRESSADRSSRPVFFVGKSAKQIRASTYRKDYSDEELKNLVWAVNLKATPARIEILRFLSEESKPISATLLRKKVKDRDEATIYRTLESLTESGIVNRTDMGKNCALYELSLGRSHHHHAVCTQCGLIEDIPACNAKNMHEQAEQYVKKFNFINRHILEFFGICKKCAKKARGAS